MLILWQYSLDIFQWTFNDYLNFMDIEKVFDSKTILNINNNLDISDFGNKNDVEIQYLVMK